MDPNKRIFLKSRHNLCAQVIDLATNRARGTQLRESPIHILNIASQIEPDNQTLLVHTNREEDNTRVQTEPRWGTPIIGVTPIGVVCNRAVQWEMRNTFISIN